MTVAPLEASSESLPRSKQGRLLFGSLIGRKTLFAVLLQKFSAKSFDVGANHSGRQLLGLFHAATPGETVSGSIWAGFQ
jgi:hypothetical protein